MLDSCFPNKEKVTKMSEKRDFRERVSRENTAIRRVWQVSCPVILATLLIMVLPSETEAQGDEIQETALEQIRALMAEKAARSDSERRLDSQLLLELKRRRGHAVARSVPSLITGIETDADDTTLVDIKADLTGACAVYCW